MVTLVSFLFHFFFFFFFFFFFMVEEFQSIYIGSHRERSSRRIYKERVKLKLDDDQNRPKELPSEFSELLIMACLVYRHSNYVCSY